MARSMEYPAPVVAEEIRDAAEVATVVGRTVFEALAQEFPTTSIEASGPGRPPTQFPTRTETVVMTDQD